MGIEEEGRRPDAWIPAAMLVLVGLLLLKWGKRGSSTDRPLFVPEDWVAEFNRPPVAA